MPGLRVFVSYSHRDEQFRRGLDRHLALLKRESLVEVWTDHLIKPGAEVDASIKEALASADLIILLVSADFIASDYCWGIEMATALERHERGAIVVPVICRACEWHTAPFGGLKALPPDGRPIAHFSRRDDAYAEVAAAFRDFAVGLAEVAEKSRSALVSLRSEEEELSSAVTEVPDANTASQWRLRDWEDVLWVLYGSAASATPVYDLMLRLVADSAGMAEAMRKRDYSEAGPLFALIMADLFSMSSKVRTEREEFSDFPPDAYLEDMAWHKYPAVCAVCAEKRCICPALSIDKLSKAARRQRKEALEPTLRIHRSKVEAMPETLDAWVGLFDGLYGNNQAQRSSASKTFHFLEEVGEVEGELRKADAALAGQPADAPIEFGDEMADVFSWLVELYLHIKGYGERAESFMDRFRTSPALVPPAEPATESAPAGDPVSSVVHVVPPLSTVLTSAFWVDGQLRCPRCGASPCNERVARR